MSNLEDKTPNKKQSRLPFKVIDIKSSTIQLMKRKLSSENESSPTPNKVSKKEEENIDTANLTKTSSESAKSNINHDTSMSDEEVLVSSESVSGTDNVACKNDDDNKESELEGSHADTSEMDASLIFEQGSQLAPGDDANPTQIVRKKRLTPTNPKKLEELEKRKKEKLRLRMEREKQLQEARDLKKKRKEEERLEREQKKLEEKEKKLKELEEKLRLKQEKKEKEEQERLEKLKAKEEEKQKKLQLLNEKHDEKKRKEEERLKKLEEKKKAEEEEERKKQKEKASFKKFFIKNESSPSAQNEEQGQCNGIFKPFEVMKNMTLASVVPDVASYHFKREDFEIAFQNQKETELYLQELKTGKRVPLCKKKSVDKDGNKNKKEINPDEEEDLIILDDNLPEQTKEKHRAKLLQFSENVRPPYYGTWMKKGSTIKGRNPFAQDTAFFDYEVDSDEEWEEGGPGESLSGSDDEKESEDDYEVDNEFFVPHGYLSADEEKDDEMGDSPEHLQKRLKMRQLEFQEELKKKCSEMKPRITGCLWMAEDDPREKVLNQKLSAYSAVTLVSIPIVTSIDVSNNEDGLTITPNASSSHTTEGKKKIWKKFPQEAMTDFIKLIHGNINGRNFLLNEFQEFWLQKTAQEGKVEEGSTHLQEQSSPLESHLNSKKGTKEGETLPQTKISKRQLELTFNKMALWMRSPDPNLNRICWWVREEIRKEHDCQDLPIPNQWNYVTKKESKEQEPLQVAAKKILEEKPQTNSTNISTTPSILKFAKVITPKLTLTPDNKKKSIKLNLDRLDPSTLPNETKAVLSNTNTLLVPKAPRRIVPTTVVKKTETEVVKKESNCQETKSLSPTNTPSLLNFVKPNARISPSSLEKGMLDCPKTAKSTPSILKFIKRTSPIQLSTTSKSPKLDEQCGGATSSHEVINLD